MIPSGHTAVMASRREPPDALDFFPTPPWATRALLSHVLALSSDEFLSSSAWDPCCGEGHMVGPLQEYFWAVEETDVFDYGKGFAVSDFLADDERTADWLITNPPFKIAEAVALRALDRAKVGVAMLVRSVWLEGTGRYERLFRDRPPTTIAQFCERVPMTKGRWDPDASTATSYAWIVWRMTEQLAAPTFTWIPPGCRRALTRPTDIVRFAARSAAAPLLPAAK
ncbi:methyltransferase [Methylobacterium radiodurans]|uniref:Methyltransferase n=1 Tax=Methylobacterium radiodurans TaxID=2202828 RepID=A0A2U8VQQ9_9HYPH|nr:methyltransferase [Methylobacterium radiodurans]AWN35761.1 methyltransferase [Methylobacterium radiodurans]